MRIKRKEKIILALGALGSLALLGAGALVVFQNTRPDIVVIPNITDEYRQDLEAELLDVRQKSLENPADIDARISIGILEQRLGRLSVAERAYHAALKINRQDYIAYMHLGILYDEMERFDKADNMLRVSTQLEPRDPKPFQALITLYKMHFPGEPDELDAILRAASDFTNSPDILAQYARFLEDRGNMHQAWVYWQEVLDTEPENEQAAENVARLARELGIGE